jgi:hypothetical protein
VHADKGNQGSFINSFRALIPEIGDDSEDLYMAESLVFNGAMHSGTYFILQLFTT